MMKIIKAILLLYIALGLIIISSAMVAAPESPLWARAVGILLLPTGVLLMVKSGIKMFGLEDIYK